MLIEKRGLTTDDGTQTTVPSSVSYTANNFAIAESPWIGLSSPTHIKSVKSETDAEKP
jgi:hypothetical protein